ncbi:hypothetical protein FACS1894190_07150 [Spirochaetia bacterium]|nr:hypothetical protein FACS1894190_07150 [Spirochaetia bacterium]
MEKVFEINPELVKEDSDLEIIRDYREDDRLIESVGQSIYESGFWKHEPIVLWGGRENILVSGRTRLRAALRKEIRKVYVIEKEFKNITEAALYNFADKIERKSLTQYEIMMLSLSGKKDTTEKGRAAELLGLRIGISKTTIYKARSIFFEGDYEILLKIREGKLTINKAYNIHRGAIYEWERASANKRGFGQGISGYNR